MHFYTPSCICFKYVALTQDESSHGARLNLSAAVWKKKMRPPPLRSLFYTASWPSQKQHWLEMEDGNVCLSWSLELSDSEKMLGDTYYDENTYATR